MADDQADSHATVGPTDVPQHEALEHLRIVTDLMSAPVTRCSRDLRYLWVSRPYAAWVRKSVDEIVGRPVVEILGPEAFATIRPHIERVLAGERVEYEACVPFRHGERWIRAIYTPTFGEGREPNGWVAVVIDIDERRRMEDALRRSEMVSRHFAALVESSEDAIISKDLNGTVRSWNPAAQRLFGYTAQEIIGQSIRTVIPSDRHAEEDRILERIRRDQAVETFETVRKHKDGSLVPVSVSVSPIRSGDAEIVGASTIARDITARRMAEQAIADLQRRLLSMVAASTTLLASPRSEDVLPATLRVALDLVPADACAIWQLDTMTQTWRTAAHSGLSETFASRVIVTGQEDGEATILRDEPLIVEDAASSKALNRQWDSYRTESIASLMAVPITRRQQVLATLTWYWRARHDFTDVEVKVARALTSLASAALTTAELYDTERRSREQSEFLARAGSVLASSLNYAETLKRIAELAVPSIADWCAVDMVDDRGQLERVAITHKDPGKIELAESLQRRYPPDPASRFGAHEVVRTGQAILVSQITDELLSRAAVNDEHLRVLRELGLTSYMCVPLISRHRVTGVLTFVSAESGHLYSSGDLHFAETIAARAVLAVTSAQAFEEAHRANRLKDEFLATLSHELRTPLNAILGYARMLKTNVLADNRRPAAIETIERNAAVLTQIVEDILDVSRIIAGKIRLNVQPVELRQVIDEAIATVRPAAEAKGIRLQVIVDPRAEPVSGDPDRLQQVVWNLLSNSVKFTPRGGRVQVRLERINSHVEIVISDTGRGIAPEFLPHLFERFRQGDSTYSREHGGLGLGLAIARSIVELHGGTIQAASEGEGRGATFRVRLPLMIVHKEVFTESVRVHPRVDAGASDDLLPRLDAVCVLAVDDEPDSLSLLRTVLEAYGARVVSETSGSDALAALARERPDVVVADIGMPGMDGFELIRRIREAADSSIRQLPAAALTAYARSEDRVRSLRSGFQMHLSKPIDPGELVAAIAALARRKDGDESP